MKAEYYNKLFDRVWKNEEHNLTIEFDEESRYFIYSLSGKDRVLIDTSFPDKNSDELTLAIWEPNIMPPRHSIIIEYVPINSAIIVVLPELFKMKFL